VSRQPPDRIAALAEDSTFDPRRRRDSRDARPSDQQIITMCPMWSLRPKQCSRRQFVLRDP
jgi:hypothetical protein